jgi:lysophospholipase L1-like esterase
MKNSSRRKVRAARVLRAILIFLMVAAAADHVAAQTKEWDYVVLGDSQSSGLFLLYAKGLEQDLGVKINILNRTVGGQSTMSLLRELRGNRDLQDALRKAKVATLNVPMAGFGYAMGAFRDGKCGGADSQDCLREALKTYQEETTAIFNEFVSLSHPSKVLVRTMDTPQMMTRTTKARGRFQVFQPYWQAANKCVIEVAAKHRIPAARVYAAFMGPNGDDDLQDKGLMSSDEVHPTPQGNDLIAKLFRDLGYQYAAP